MTNEAVLPVTRRSTVTVGTFDGLHRGHREVLLEIVRRARATDRASVVVTFEPHPLEVVAPERAPRLLTPWVEKRLLLPLFDIDYVHVLPFTESLRRLSPEMFVRRILIERLRVAELVIGHDHGFGRDRTGDVDTLRRIGAEEGFDVDVVGAVKVGNVSVSSTSIRRAVEAGNLAAAAEGLGRSYAILGEVVAGAGRGRELGFPTANLRIEGAKKCLPPEGVYAARVDVEGTRYDAMANFGGRPTFGEREPRLEAHLLDWPGEPLYGARLWAELVARLRPVRRFAGGAALAAQLESDRRETRLALTRGAAPEQGVA